MDSVYWLLRGKENPITAIRSLGDGQRGMAFFSDIDDWLEGTHTNSQLVEKHFNYFHVKKGTA